MLEKIKMKYWFDLFQGKLDSTGKKKINELAVKSLGSMQMETEMKSQEGGG